MFTEETMSLLVQSGLAGLFAVFAIYLTRMFMTFVKEMNASWQAEINSFKIELSKLSTAIAKLNGRD